MESFLLALGSLVILVPLLYFLPLGLSLRGKIIVIVFALFLATIGLVINLTYPLWLTGLVLLFLVLIFTIFLNAKFKKHLYSEASPHEHEAHKEPIQESDKDSDDLDTMTAEETANPNKLLSDPEEEIIDSEEEPLIVEQQLLEKKEVEEDTQEYSIEVEHPEPIVQDSDSIEAEEHYTTTSQDTDIVEVEPSETNEQEAENEDLVSTQDEQADEVPKAGEDSSTVHTDEHVEESNRSVERRTALQQQLFHTMISQLHLARKRMNRDDYERMIQEHLHPNLPALDYYTFSSLLIEHYIRNKELVKLNYLLLDLKERMKDYPILVMEIQYLYEQYCENIL